MQVILFVILSLIPVLVLVCLNVFIFYDSFGFERKSFFKEAWAHFKESIGLYVICFVCFTLLFISLGLLKAHLQGAG